MQSQAESKSTESNQTTSLEQFKNIIKEHLVESEEDHETRFVEFNKFLNKYNAHDKWCQDRCIQGLVSDYSSQISEQSSVDSKFELFEELTKELLSHFLKKPVIDLPVSEQKKRMNRIHKIKKMLFRCERKIEILTNKEMSLDDLDKEDGNVMVRIDKYQKRVVKLYEEMRKLQNMHVYYGEDPIDFQDVTNSPELNSFLEKEILIKFMNSKKKSEKYVQPEYNEVLELVTKYSNESGKHFNPKDIFEKICNKFRIYNLKKLEFSLKYYTDNKEEQPVETDELIKKLSTQNKFVDQLDEIVKKYSDPTITHETEEEQEEESFDSESDSLDEDAAETFSESEDEFIGKSQNFTGDEETEDSESCNFENEPKTNIEGAQESGQSKTIEPKPSQSEPVELKPSQSESIELKPSQSESIELKPSQSNDSKYETLEDDVITIDETEEIESRKRESDIVNDVNSKKKKLDDDDCIILE